MNNRGYWIESQEINFIMIWDYHFLGDNLRFEYSKVGLLESGSEVDDLEYKLITIWDLWE